MNDKLQFGPWDDKEFRFSTDHLNQSSYAEDDLKYEGMGTEQSPAELLYLEDLRLALTAWLLWDGMTLAQKLEEYYREGMTEAEAYNFVHHRWTILFPNHPWPLAVPPPPAVIPKVVAEKK